MSDPNTRYEEGLKVRRKVLGDAYVDNALQGADELGAALQKLVTEYCWGTVWTRDGLDHRTRSLLNVAMLSALDRPHELAIHIRGALRNGCTPDELKEVVLQIAVYAGVPAGIDAMRHLRKALADHKAEAL